MATTALSLYMEWSTKKKRWMMVDTFNKEIEIKEKSLHFMDVFQSLCKHPCFIKKQWTNESFFLEKVFVIAVI